MCYAFGLFATAQVQSLCLHQYFHRVFRVGMHARTSVITTVYRKSLRLSMGAKQADTVGQMVNLMAVDARRLNDLLPYLHNIWSSPFQIVVSMFMLWAQIGPAVLAGLTVMLIVMPLNAWMAQVQQRMQKNLMEARDERVKIFNEVLNGIKVSQPKTTSPHRAAIHSRNISVRLLACGDRSSKCTPGRPASRRRSRPRE